MIMDREAIAELIEIRDSLRGMINDLKSRRIPNREPYINLDDVTEFYNVEARRPMPVLYIPDNGKYYFAN